MGSRSVSALLEALLASFLEEDPYPTRGTPLMIHERKLDKQMRIKSSESIEQFHVEQRGDLAMSGWEPQPAASVFLPNIARLSSAAAHYESDRTNRNVRFVAWHGRF
jgi:hypothetical protein